MPSHQFSAELMPHAEPTIGREKSALDRNRYQWSERKWNAKTARKMDFVGRQMWAVTLFIWNSFFRLFSFFFVQLIYEWIIVALDKRSPFRHCADRGSWAQKPRWRILLTIRWMQMAQIYSVETIVFDVNFHWPQNFWLFLVKTNAESISILRTDPINSRVWKSNRSSSQMKKKSRNLFPSCILHTAKVPMFRLIADI